MKHLVVRLESPLMAFGGETVDHFGVTRRFPALSMLTGLFANALGWCRTDGASHQHLQDRMIFAARVDREPAPIWQLRDFQTAKLDKERAWTTRGAPEERKGGTGTYKSPHIRYRDYLADMVVTVALRLEPPDNNPNLDRLAESLQQPARPLFIGRKPCLPSAPLFEGFTQARTALAALVNWPLTDTPTPDHTTTDTKDIQVFWSADEPTDTTTTPTHTYQITDQRNWNTSGLHGGNRPVHESRIPRTHFPTTTAGTDNNEHP